MELICLRWQLNRNLNRLRLRQATRLQRRTSLPMVAEGPPNSNLDHIRRHLPTCLTQFGSPLLPIEDPQNITPLPPFPPPAVEVCP